MSMNCDKSSLLVGFYFEADYSQEMQSLQVHQKCIYGAKDGHQIDSEYLFPPLTLSDLLCVEIICTEKNIRTNC